MSSFPFAINYFFNNLPLRIGELREICFHYIMFLVNHKISRFFLFYKLFKFQNKLLDFFPFKISHILTDNGLERSPLRFTNKLIMSKKGNLCVKDSLLDIKCNNNGIDHRLTKPATPKTNGMVERANGTIKNGTILKNEYNDSAEMSKDLMDFLVYYNIYKRHGSLKKELDVKTPFQAVDKWFTLKPELFKIRPEKFKNKIFNLNKNTTTNHQQPCET